MPHSLREAWAGHITPEDYERHMASTGQPQANADLLAELFRTSPPAPGSRILIAGAGTGQYFDYWTSASLAQDACVCTDINPIFLARLAARFPCEAVVDNIEAPSVEGPFDLAIVMLVLEHVDWRRAVSALCGLAARIFTVTQENPPGLTARRLPGTLGILADYPSRLVDRGELIAHFGAQGFVVARTSVREVADGKRMVGLDFRTAKNRTFSRAV